MNKQAETVFLSSTCYDLIDLRSEIEMQLRELQLTPLLSDSATSEFDVLPTANSIESCLVNVRRADIIIFVLSQRYGPSLQIAGYDDISATHLEYREARRSGKHIYFYVRDRLEADYNIWKRNSGTSVRLSWVADKDFGLFKLLEEHRQLSASSNNTNWFWTFRDSLDLKQRIQKDLKHVSDAAVLKSIIQSGKSPFLLAEIKSFKPNKTTNSVTLELSIINAGASVALQPFISIFSSKDEVIEIIATILPGERRDVSLDCKILSKEFRKGGANFGLRCMYSTAEGHLISDCSDVGVDWSKKRSDWGLARTCEYRGKRYHHSNGIELNLDDEDV